VEITTSNGLTGLGECTLGGKGKTVEAAVKDNSAYLMGRDPHLIEDSWQAIYKGAFLRGGPVLTAALSGIETALWDILGQEHGMPIHQFLGGAVRKKIRAYAWPDGSDVEEIVESSKDLVRKGWTALKFDAFSSVEGEEKPESTVARNAVGVALAKTKAVREAVGEDIDIMIDLHGRPTVVEAMKFIKEAEAYDLYFIEEPITPENADVLADLKKASRSPIATGERIFTRFGFREIFEKRACHIIQPDLCHAGGIFEGRKIAAMAEAYFIQVAPHNPFSPVSTAACIQLDACIPNFSIQEVNISDMPWRSKLIRNAPEVTQGYFDIPSKPGLGVELNHNALSERPYEPAILPRMKREDGTVTEW